MATATPEAEATPAGDALEARYREVLARIEAAARRSGRSGREVILVAVTKHAGIEQIRRLLELGHVDFGENRLPVLQQHAAQVDEYLERVRTVPSAAPGDVPDRVRWHMIGHLQRNKVRKVLPLVRLVHSVDSLRLAEEIQSVAATRMPEGTEIPVLVQVNAAEEKQKHGIAPAAARHVVDQMETMFNLRIRGLMCMAPLTEDEDRVRSAFGRCRELFEDIRASGHAPRQFDLLSMGMSNDYEIAIEEGANLVRVGSAIFAEPDADPDGGVEPEGSAD